EGFGEMPAGTAEAPAAAAADLAPAPRRAVGVRSAAGAAGSATFVSAGPCTRRFTFSTTTALLRPWLKLWRTTPCSPPLSVSVLVGVTVSVFSPGFFVVSVIQFPLLSRNWRGPNGALPAFRRIPTL